MITIQWPPLELPLLSYILAANLLTIFIGYVVEHKYIKPYIFDSIYLFLIISTLFIFFSAALHSKNFEILAITIIVVCYILIAIIFFLMLSLWLMTEVKGMRILREYERGIKEEREIKEE
jgi:hypothetical protein